MGQLLRRDADHEIGLQQQGRDQRDQIGIAAALAQAVQRALDLPRAGAERRQAVGDRILGVVVAMDADLAARDPGHLADDALDLMRQRPAIGVAEHEPARPGALGRLQAIEGIGGIGLVAVEEMLGVEHRLGATRDRQRDALLDHGEILAALDAERDIDLEVPALADHADGRRARPHQRGQPRIIAHAAAGPAGHAEGGELGRLQGRRPVAKKASSVGLAPGQPPSI